MKNKFFNAFQEQIKSLIKIEKISKEVFKKYDIDLSIFGFNVLSVCSHWAHGGYEGSFKQSFENLKRIISFLKSTERNYYVTLSYKDNYERVFVEIFFYLPKLAFYPESLVGRFTIVYGTDTFGRGEITEEIEKYISENGEKIETFFPEQLMVNLKTGARMKEQHYCKGCRSYRIYHYASDDMRCRIRKVDLYQI
ncbi:MAG: hypothetical protein PF549_04970 [Patescibacteria group bacterium]|jgi:hypothetical protein|nr:hypothetical protein [Patescibacteria group bacterium]